MSLCVCFVCVDCLFGVLSFVLLVMRAGIGFALVFVCVLLCVCDWFCFVIVCLALVLFVLSVLLCLFWCVIGLRFWFVWCVVCSGLNNVLICSWH